MGEKTIKIGRFTVALSKTDKVLYADDGITKGDLVGYYREVGEWMLPETRGRPVAMVRMPDGIGGERIFQKDVPDHFPGWITRARVEKRGGSLEQVICDKVATLVYLANQGCIEPHVFLSRVDRIDSPDHMVFDLDPPDRRHFPDARRGALTLRALLEEELGLSCFVKTTGGKGLHVHVPLDRRSDFDGVRDLAREVADELASRYPGEMTMEQRKDARGQRLFIDWLRNSYAQTVVAPYAVRARPGAPVATPVHWEEVEDSDLRPDRFTLHTLPERLRRVGNPWAGMTRRSHSLGRSRRQLERIAS